MILLRSFFYFCKQGVEISLSSVFWFDVETLEPPDVFVGPVAPFIGDHKLGDNGVVVFYNKVESFVWVGDERGDAVFGLLIGYFFVF